MKVEQALKMVKASLVVLRKEMKSHIFLKYSFMLELHILLANTPLLLMELMLGIHMPRDLMGLQIL